MSYTKNGTCHINCPKGKYRIQARMVHQDPLFDTHKDALPQSVTCEDEDVYKMADANDIRGVHGRLVIKYL